MKSREGLMAAMTLAALAGATQGGTIDVRTRRPFRPKDRAVGKRLPDKLQQGGRAFRRDPVTGLKLRAE